MLRKILHSKIHRARVTSARLDYVGSITIDADILDAVGLRANDAVVIANCDNGERFETYVFRGERGSKQIIINGAAARLAGEGHTVIIMHYAFASEDEYRAHKPAVALMRPDNTIEEIIHYDNR
ncbi:MAG: aspartate 1-decarboxylase [Phycisphaeraceae bacterium]|nr:aspartate 1-decarboxylase [Phycisphaeraceae bacterium]MBX3362591.1 aspartate 1-decarboxylase [Phycisphaeraceae bacterium]MBX3368432.1 aspartate 1-decarboxylase [Phycisphaeraceae bacterium]MCW5769171.1 aspartate 1-decarboxylase [Phycisphaeraceae bacterium]QYK49007.1 MAG: aspartate 1-decarboxylase [Phycisphaeraceae bacterium]